MTTLKRGLAATVLTVGAAFAALPAAIATPLALGGPWVILDQTMSTGDFFTAPDTGIYWTLNCPASGCKFLITDILVATDRFEVYDSDVLIATTPLLPDWTALAAGPFDSPPWTDDPDIAFSSGFFSSLTIALAPGLHSLSIKDIHIPPTLAGAPFADGTVAFRAVVPEPATLALLGLALVGLGFVRRKKEGLSAA